MSPPLAAKLVSTAYYELQMYFGNSPFEICRANEHEVSNTVKYAVKSVKSFSTMIEYFTEEDF